jgi:tRNA (cmo5U34)-methyltransferase
MNNNKHPQPHIHSFGEEHARSYDQNNSYLTPINANLHYLIEILLTDLKSESKILCVGAGTGTEIIALARAFPKFTFVAVDPSGAMLNVCRERIENLGMSDRCQFVTGVVDDVPEIEKFDAVLCLLVLHHTSEYERQGIVSGIAKRLKENGYFISSELSADLAASTAGNVMKNWKFLSRRAGISEEKIQILPETMNRNLGIMSPFDYENLLRKNGFDLPVQFFQSFMIRAWYAQKLS